MKADNVHRSAQLVALHRELGHACDKLLKGEGVGQTVRIKIERWEVARELATIGIPPTYLAKAISDYRDALQLEAETLGVEFSE